jgi:uncharacterized protein involved in outer membrane biogenesis
VDVRWSEIKQKWRRSNGNASALVPPTGRRPRSRYRALKWTGGIILGSLAAIVLVLAFVDWNMLRRPVGHYMSNRMHREVRLDGDLKVELFSWTPTAEVNGLHIAQPDWTTSVKGAAQDAFADIDRLTVSVDLRELLSFHIVLPQLAVEQPRVALLRDTSGHANWIFEEEKNPRPFHLPPIRHFIIRDGRLTVLDQQKKLQFAGTVSSEETDSKSGRQFFSLIGKGELNRTPFSAEVRGDPLLNVDPDRPYDFDGHVRAGATRIDAKGSLGKPFDLGAFKVTADFAGADLGDLYYLTGLTFPNTPPYHLSGGLTRDGNVFHFSNFGGKLGSSDLHGELTVDATGDKPYLKADIASQQLNFDDLGPLIGAAGPKAQLAKTVVAAPQTTPAARTEATALVLPDTPLNVERLRQMDADVHYRAARVVSQDFPLRVAETKLSLKNGVLKLTPVSFAFARGTLNGNVQIDARKDLPVSDIDVHMTGLSLQQFMPAAGGQPALEGEAVARAKLHGVGNSIHKGASTADGTVSFVVPHGEIRQTFAELLGINVTNALGLLLTGDQSQVDVRCMVAGFQAHNGVLQMNQFAFDTPVVLATGEGSVDLRNEQMRFAVTGHPKKPQLVRLRAPITVSGPLAHPAVGVQAGPAIAQGGIAVGLAALLSPLAAILPFVDPGLGKDTDCGALLAQAQSQGAPVKQAEAQNSGPQKSLKR